VKRRALGSARGRALLFAMSIGAGLTLTALACSESNNAPRERFDAASPPGASLPEASTGAEDDAATAPDVLAPYDGAADPVVCDASPCVVRLVAGPSLYCGIIDDGTVRCWGDSTLLTPAIDADAGAEAGADPGPGPVTIGGVADAVDLAITASRACAVLADGGVDCWDQSATTPTRLADAPATKRLALGTDMSCAVATSGELDCWGDSAIFGSRPRAIDLGGRKAVDVVVTDTAAFVLDEDGLLRSWGQSGLLLGRATSLMVDDVARAVTDLPKARSIASSSAHACAATTDGRLFCWGAAGDAMLGLGYSRDEHYPVAVSFPPGDFPYQVSAEDSHSCARSTAGTIACWGGENPWGELGYATKSAVYVPSKVAGLPPDVVAIAVGLSSSCALAKDGAVWCWGDDRNGQLGQGHSDSARHWTPARVVLP